MCDYIAADLLVLLDLIVSWHFYLSHWKKGMEWGQEGDKQCEKWETVANLKYKAELLCFPCNRKDEKTTEKGRK